MVLPAKVSNNLGSSSEEPMCSDYMDLGLVDIKMSKRATIKMMLEIQDTTKDKLTYMLHTLNLLFSSMLAVYAPQYYYVWHSIVTVALIGYRFKSYIRLRQQFFLLDFCYYMNVLYLLYLWLPERLLGPELRGRLFTICFNLAIGPVLLAAMVWRVSLVPHSNDKMTSIFIHLSPSLSLLCIRWYSTPDQGFPLCVGHFSGGVAACSNLPILETLIYPLAAYIVWQATYLVLVDLVCWKKIIRGNFSTSYLVLLGAQGKLAKLFSLLGPSFRKPLFVTWQVIYTFTLINLTYYCYFYKFVNVATLAAALAYASYNGASFYIDVFSYKYRREHSRRYNVDG